MLYDAETWPLTVRKYLGIFEIFEKRILWSFVGLRETNGEDQLDRSCEKWRSITQSQGGEKYPTYNKKKKDWIGHMLRRNCLLKHVIEGKLEGR
jgi:hypothetical protein